MARGECVRIAREPQHVPRTLARELRERATFLSWGCKKMGGLASAAKKRLLRLSKLSTSECLCTVVFSSGTKN